MEDKFSEELAKAKKQYDEALEAGQIEKSASIRAHAPFFLKLSEKSISTAGLLFEISGNDSRKKDMSLPSSYEGYLWVIVTSYYSMFYMASGLIALKEIKMGNESTHKNVRNAFFRLYIENNNLEKQLGIDYSEVKEMAEDLMREREKRSRYQYNVGTPAMKTDAEVSLRRARNFFEKARLLF